MTRTSPVLTYADARTALDASLAKAAEMGIPSSIAILDGGRELVAFARMTDALLGGIEVASVKAYTAASMQMPSGDLYPLVQPGQPLYGLDRSHDRPLLFVAGGLPLTLAGTFVGAVGVSGGSVEQDTEIATAGVLALEGA